MVLQQSQTIAGESSATNFTPVPTVGTPEKTLRRHSKGNPGGRPRSYVIRPGAWRLSAALCSTCLGLGTVALVARTLSPDSFGIYTFVCWLATVAIPIVATSITDRQGSSIVGVGFMPTLGWGRSSPTPQVTAGIFQFLWQRQYRRVLLYCLVYLLLIGPLWWFYRATAPVAYLFLAGVLALPLLFSGVVSKTLHDLHRHDLLAAFRLFGAVATLLLITIAIEASAVGANPQMEIGIFLLSLAVANTLALLLALICIFRLLPVRQAVKPGPLSQARLTQGFRKSTGSFILDAIVWQPCAMLLLALRYNNEAMPGIYALSSIISTYVMGIAPTVFSAFILPLLLRYVPFYRYTSVRAAFFKTSLSIALIALPISICLGLFCPFVIATCFGSAYLPVVLPLRILLISSTLGSIATVSVTHLSQFVGADLSRPRGWGQSHRKPSLTGQGAINRPLRIGAACLGIGLGIPGVAIWGVMGAAFASAIAQGVFALGSMIICTKYMLSIRGGNPWWLPACPSRASGQPPGHPHLGNG